MELDNIERLLEAYFEGNTTLAQEQELRAYFTRDDVAAHLAPYKPMFNAFAKAKQETFNQEVKIPQSNKKWQWASYAASIAACIALFLLIKGGPLTKQDYGTYEDPEIAALKTKQALFMLTDIMNEGTQQLELLSEFEKTTDKYIKQ